jgi:fluoroacetyl-CoA thioesterase
MDMATASVRHVVTDADTAAALGSGELNVLGTPRVIAWCEQASCAALDLPDGQTSVGTRVNIEHLAPTPVGATVTARATVIYHDGRLVRFQVVAVDDSETLVATGEVTRVVVDRERFLSRVAPVGD